LPSTPTRTRQRHFSTKSSRPELLLHRKTLVAPAAGVFACPGPVSTSDVADAPSGADRFRAVGVVVDAVALAGVLLYGEPLTAHATRALVASRVEPVTADTPWASVVARGLPLVVHDAACPLTPAWFIAAQVDYAVVLDRVRVGVRPVTDTIKTVAAGRVGATVDRESLVEVAAPVVLPASLVASLGGWPDLTDVPALVGRLRGRALVDLVKAPVLARRVEDASAVRVLEAFAELQPPM
jgi:2-C-methyl-D-erythritol 4-phosphate cytidylyltransferase